MTPRAGLDGPSRTIIVEPAEQPALPWKGGAAANGAAAAFNGVLFIVLGPNWFNLAGMLIGGAVAGFLVHSGRRARESRA